jgi:hypothetical protein
MHFLLWGSWLRDGIAHGLRPGLIFPLIRIPRKFLSTRPTLQQTETTSSRATPGSRKLLGPRAQARQKASPSDGNPTAVANSMISMMPLSPPSRIRVIGRGRIAGGSWKEDSPQRHQLRVRAAAPRRRPRPVPGKARCAGPPALAVFIPFQRCFALWNGHIAQFAAEFSFISRISVWFGFCFHFRSSSSSRQRRRKKRSRSNPCRECKGSHLAVRALRVEKKSYLVN